MSRWAAIIGARGTGKSTHAVRVAQALKRRGVHIGGFVQEALEDEFGKRSYDVISLTSSRRLALARPGLTPEPEPGHTTMCSYSFADAAFDQARQWLMRDIEGGAQVVFIDEVSKLEVSGQGHFPTIEASLADGRPITLLCIRADQLFYVVDKLGLESDPVAVLEIPPENGAFDAFVDQLVSKLHPSPSLPARAS